MWLSSDATYSEHGDSLFEDLNAKWGITLYYCRIKASLGDQILSLLANSFQSIFSASMGAA